MSTGIKTEVIWNTPPTDPAILEEANLRASLQVQECVEIRNAEIPQLIAYRFWVDQTAAESWIAFILPYNPVSAQIVT